MIAELACGGKDYWDILQVLGGTAQRGDTDLTPREEDRQHIWQGCLRMMPSLAQAKVQQELHACSAYTSADVYEATLVHPGLSLQNANKGRGKSLELLSCTGRQAHV